MFKKTWFKIVDWFISTIIGKTTWQKLYAKTHDGKEYLLTESEQQKVMDILKQTYCVVVTRRNSHLSTYASSIGHWLALLLHGQKPKLGYWGHCLMNCEKSESITGFQLIEAIGRGVGYSSFDDIFHCDGVALLVPDCDLSINDWNKALEYEKEQLGKPYDTLIDFTNPDRQTCIELVFNTLVCLGNKGNAVLPVVQLQTMLGRYGALTPQMLYDCKGFKIIFEVRH